MSGNQVKQSIKDVIPAFQGSYPPQLISFAEYLYSSSLQRLPMIANKGEVARYHLCAYLAVEKYRETLSLPEPSDQMIPVKPSFRQKLLDDFRALLVYQEKSASVTPRSSPRKSKTLKSSPKSTPFSTPESMRLSTGSRKSSPLKKLQALADSDDSDTKSPENMHGNTPSKSDVGKSPFNPARGSQTPGSKSEKKVVTIPELVEFANNFFIPASVTPLLIKSFLNHKHKLLKKNEWLLACGLISAVYTRINYKLLQKTISAKSQFQNQLYQYQKGSLPKWNMILWCDLIDNAVKNEPWILELEQKYVYGVNEPQTSVKDEFNAKYGQGWELMQTLGFMINPSVSYNSTSQTDYYNTWSNRALSMLD
ncbi:Piso0_003361 [Millerozyma farinosa CBS 7064]|uniref:Piso0_003361 protein n=1 Tax=Pichia sorbitophila (strain ATCC MYA-4447 / BCRC 22081 / CBS 7064 / NBRC 10061 / NRRL Y-12695) TaxID=559304 RepID=G8YHX0_PICSO|nr:Piso0_003361 [Millerozyma farinosa CBS 7064]CCE81022.1 Piso0_003361 [Millerozyma farinosa CBS 7064]